MKIIAIANQSLYDIANQEFGSIEAAFHIAVLNGRSVTYLPEPGEVIELPDMVFKKDVADYFKNNKIKIATVTKISAIPEPENIDNYSLCGEFPYSF